MAEINLRHYVQEIDDLIEDSDRLEEAIAHCRHILQTFPKHIDTYRLLGKAYLESKRFGDSADIFQRVLSALPEDYVSHVGMAIIREDEGNLDASIWHMERASESKPGNAAIEQELKRLIGKRDGLEPQRVRPTRGALARMYSHGELFSYAITELNRALEEDSDRPDLQVLLANTYWRTDQRLEAVRLCSEILEKLPFCRDANRITAALLQESGKSAEAARNIRRLVSLDPYFAHLKNPMDDPLSVEASAIVLDKLHWMHGEPVTGAGEKQPDWAASLGVDFRRESEEDEEQPEEVPDWLKSKAEDEETPSETPKTGPIPIHPFAGAEPPIGADIPQWMQEAGWVENDGTAVETSPDELFETGGSLEEPGELAAAEMPDWLSQIPRDEAPEIEHTPDEIEKESDDGSVDEAFLDSLGIEPGSQDEADFDAFGVEAEAEPALANEGSLDSESPDWLTQINAEIPEAGIVDTGESASDLYSAKEIDEGTAPSVDEFVEEITEDVLTEASLGDTSTDLELASQEDIPSEEPAEAVGPFGDFEEFESEDGTRDLPSWLEPATPGATDTIVSWLGDKSGDELPSPSEDIPTWMKGTGPLVERPVDRSSESDFAKPEPEELAEHPFPFAPEPELPISEDVGSDVGAPAEDWLEGTSASDLAADEALMQDQDQEPAWMDTPPVDGEQVPALTSEETPEWLQEFSDGDEEIESPPEEDQPEWLTTAVVSGEDKIEPEGEEQPEWLRTLASETPADEVKEPEPEEPPEWISEMAPEGVKSDVADEETAPDWMVELEEGTADTQADLEPEVASVSAEEGGVSEEVPGWMLELESEPDEAAQAAEPRSEEGFATETGLPFAEEEAEGVPEVKLEITEEPTGPIGTEMAQPLVEMDEPLEMGSEESEDLTTEPEEIPWMESEVDSDIESIRSELIDDDTLEPPVEAKMETEVDEEEAPDWLRDLAVDELPSGPVDFTEAEVVDETTAESEAAEWLQRIETEAATEIPITPLEEMAGEVVEPEPVGETTEAAWRPEFEETEGDEDEMDTNELIAAEKEIEQRLEWLQDSAQAVSPEPEVEAPKPSLESKPAEAEIPELAERTDGELDEGEVIEYLESLADVGEGDREETSLETSVQDTAEVEAIAADEIETEEVPEDLDAGLEWLEELATDEADYEEVIAPDFQADEDAMADSDVPDWLEEVAEPEGEKGSEAEELDAEIKDIDLKFVEVDGELESAPQEKDPSILDTIVTKRPVFDTIEFDQEQVMGNEPESPSGEGNLEGQVPSEPTAGLMPEPSEPPVRFEAEVEKMEAASQELEAPSGEAEAGLDTLALARKAIQTGEIERAIDLYAELIEEKQDLDSVTGDLESAVEKTPMSPILWQTLGDAYMQMGEVADAINAYRKGMEAV